MRVFFDSSALVKRYITEQGTDAVLRRCGQADEVLLSAVCLPEIVGAFCRLKREGRISDGAYHDLKNELALDISQATVVEISAEVLADTVSCLERAALRTLAAIHVASARRCDCELFVSADRRQCALAGSLGIRAELVE